VSKIHPHGTGHGPGPDHDPDDEQSRGDRGIRLELIITIGLGLAAMVGAFAAYRNEQRNHSATEQFSFAVRNFDDAGQFYATGNATFSNDQALFLEYAKAVQQNDKRLADYIFSNLMGPTLRAAVKWWEGPNARAKHPAKTPFTASNPDYSVPQIAAAKKSTELSKANFAEARKQQEDADHFTLVEVILATALFLYGIAGVTRNLTLRLGTLGIGGLIFVISVILLLTG